MPMIRPNSGLRHNPEPKARGGASIEFPARRDVWLNSARFRTVAEVVGVHHGVRNRERCGRRYCGTG